MWFGMTCMQLAVDVETQLSHASRSCLVSGTKQNLSSTVPTSGLPEEVMTHSCKIPKSRLSRFRLLGTRFFFVIG